ncbi:MAG: hypothetical protein A3C93_06105 [Candidatus Lloydbacteria bacterium RIFCSPHIGHO2_02_FULL_54_17]|uniref:DUF2914 domain-containing protein n=1 Tax=Candidatus Lloydbacteria bacterium RIFCSPHIGHO2_02_FULL_54_17 TaxID=1798664 RepID=A0A1G2DGV6_9BACT|nr:MAG: hypothetical protein A3C93_06105 [Candidatus Lloydbacteria bacterium RIFCSPHIGHO2_02_FULL_54_17]OGZ13504.1 MAG: hypothetical protein A2948_04770 [Candidatus Lloydbacteria bacterium RIFCSPLOWO2_01_FULL_54_18]OGZ16176.1 MAG: hypothetical protein A3H76_03605 [Candidatus Lloydbacteria bacterium RIFCSPLOWO2_02_FULL_54_12]
MDLMRKYERHLSGIAFVVGFMLDYTFAPRIDSPYTPLVLGVYLLLAGLAIALQQTLGQKATKRPVSPWLLGILPTAIQFVFGALMSMLFVYYSRSAALAGSWPFMLLLGAMFLGNEVFRDRVRLFKFQLGTFFFVFTMAAVLCTPIILRELGTIPFLIAGGVSFVGTLLLIAFITLHSRTTVRENIFGVLIMVGGMYLLINVLYFTHLIPPIPLLLRESGVYHYIVRDVNGNYVGSAEISAGGGSGMPWKSPEVLRLSRGEPAYFYSAVFAPIAMGTPIVHRWEFADTQTGEWKTLHRVSFPIVGGRDGGYRGYSIKETVAPGKWRVSVETLSGELLERKTFLVEFSSEKILLKETVLK